MPEKKCTKCGEVKNQLEFYRQDTGKDGFKCECIVCCKKYHAQYRVTEQAREANRRAVKRYLATEHGQETHRCADATWKATEHGQEVCRRASQQYRTTEHGKETIRQYHKKYRAENPEKGKARDAVHNEIRRGRLVRQPCGICGKTPADAHHDDYSKPLEVQWLCRKHHKQYHCKQQIEKE